MTNIVFTRLGWNPTIEVRADVPRVGERVRLSRLYRVRSVTHVPYDEAGFEEGKRIDHGMKVVVHLVPLRIVRRWKGASGVLYESEFSV